MPCGSKEARTITRDSNECQWVPIKNRISNIRSSSLPPSVRFQVPSSPFQVPAGITHYAISCLCFAGVSRIVSTVRKRARGGPQTSPGCFAFSAPRTTCPENRIGAHSSLPASQPARASEPRRRARAIRGSYGHKTSECLTVIRAMTACRPAGMRCLEKTLHIVTFYIKRG